MSRRIVVAGPCKLVITTIDDCDYDLFQSYKWTVTDDNRGHRYIRTSNRTALFLHKLILDIDSSIQVDHRDGNTLNNRRKNLRLATFSENSRNKVSNTGSSQYKGVSWVTSRERWIACIYIGGKNITLGYFRDEYKAALAYNQAASINFGEFAKLNDMVEPHE